MSRGFWVLIVALAVVVVIVTTSLGVGISPDSTAYIGTARRWLVRLHATGVRGPISQSSDFGPLYPATLALGSLMSRQDPRLVARWLNVLAFPTTLLLVGLLVRRAAQASKSAPIAAALVILTSVPILVIHSMAWTEPLFLLFFLIDVVLVDRYLRQATRSGLVLVACATAACVLERFVGLSCVGMTAIALFVWGPGSRAARATSAFIVCLAALVPYVAWRLSSSDYRTLDLHPAALKSLSSAVDVMGGWVIPHRAGLPTAWQAGTAVLIVLVVSSVVYLRRPRVPPPSRSFVLRLLAIFAGCYVALLISSLAVWDALVAVDARMLAPLELAAVIAVATLLARSRWRTAIPIALGILWFSVRTIDAASWIVQTHREGLWYSSRSWQESPTIRAVLAFPPGMLIVTNGDDAVGAVADRKARRLPNLINPATFAPNPDYENDLADLHQRLRANHGVIVLFDRLSDRFYIPGEAELSKLWKLSVVAQFSDGAIYRLRED